MIVADANLVARILIRAEETEEVFRVQGRDPSWCAPALLRSEIRNVFLQQIRLRGLSLPDALDLQALAGAVVSTVEMAPHASSILERAVDLGISAYDAEYVVLAESIGAVLVTLDRGLAARAPHIALSPAAFLEAGEVNERARVRGEGSPGR